MIIRKPREYLRERDFWDTFWETRDWRTHPRCAVCSAGKDRWFWCVTNGFADWGDGRVVVDVRISGVASSKEAALEAAEAHAPEDAVLESASLAAQARRDLAYRARAARNATKPPAPPQAEEFVYTIHGGHRYDEPGWDPLGLTEHLIVRKTPRYLFIQGRRNEDRTIRLDRETLERDGSVHPGRWWEPEFYLQPPDLVAMEAQHRHRAHQTPPPAVAAAFGQLGVSFPAETSDIERAFRRAAVKHHPDRGGDAETFIALRSAYEIAIAFATEAA